MRELCSKCGIRPRYKKGRNTWCKQCKAEADAASYQKRLASWRKFRKKYLEQPEGYKKALEYNNAWNKKNPQKVFAYRIQSRYGITPFQYQSMLAAQNYSCAVCGKPFEHRRINIDHDHQTMRVRGLLCFTCNKFRVASNTKEMAKKVYEYLTRPKALGL